MPALIIIYNIDNHGHTVDNNCKICATSYDVNTYVSNIDTSSYVHTLMETPYYKEWKRFFKTMFKSLNLKVDWYNLTMNQAEYFVTIFTQFSQNPPPFYTEYEFDLLKEIITTA